MIRSFFSLFKPSCPIRPVLGRWSLKNNCPSEEIAVFNANRDHCGDKLCGDQEEYKKMVPKTKTKIDSNGK